MQKKIIKLPSMATAVEFFLIKNIKQKIPRSVGSFYCNGAQIEVNIYTKAAIYQCSAKKSMLTLSWRKSLSYRNQSKSMNWFLYDSDFRYERVKIFSKFTRKHFYRCLVFNEVADFTLAHIFYRTPFASRRIFCMWVTVNDGLSALGAYLSLPAPIPDKEKN